MVTVQIFKSDIFSGRHGKGSFDPWDPQLRPSVSGATFEIKVPKSATGRDVQKEVAAVIKDADTPEQCLLWAVDPSIGPNSVKGAPHLLRIYGDVPFYEEKYGEGLLGGQRLWLHVVPSSK